MCNAWGRRGILFAIFCCFSTSLDAAEPMAVDEASFFYNHDGRVLSLANPGDFAEISTTEVGFRIRVWKLGLAVVHGETRVSVFGRGSNSFRSAVSAGGNANFEYSDGIETKSAQIPVKDLWDRVLLPQDASSEAILQTQGGAQVRLPSEAVRKYLRDHAEAYDYRVAPQMAFAHLDSDASGTYAELRSQFFEFWDQVDLGRLFSGVEMELRDWLPPEQREAYLTRLRTEIERLDMTYRDLAEQYLESWRDRLDSMDGANFRAAVRVDYDITLGPSDWDMDIQSEELGFFLAFQALEDREKSGILEFRTGLSRNSTEAAFHIFEVVGRARGRMDVEAEASVYEDGQAVWSESVQFGAEGTIDVPLDLRDDPLFLLSPKREYTLVHVGVGYFLKDSTQFEIELGYRTSGHRKKKLERAKLYFSQKVFPWFAFHLGGSYRQIASQVAFSSRNVPREALEQDEVDRFNQDLDEFRDYIGDASFTFGIALGKNIALNMADLRVLGPNLWAKTGVKVEARGIECRAHYEQYRFLLPGDSTGLPVEEFLDEAGINLRPFYDHLELGGESLVPDNRIVDNRWLVGVGVNRDHYAVRPALEFGESRLRAIQLDSCFKKLKLGKERTLGLDWGIRYDLDRDEIGAFRISIGTAK